MVLPCYADFRISTCLCFFIHGSAALTCMSPFSSDAVRRDPVHANQSAKRYPCMRIAHAGPQDRIAGVLGILRPAVGQGDDACRVKVMVVDVLEGGDMTGPTEHPWESASGPSEDFQVSTAWTGMSW